MLVACVFLSWTILLSVFATYNKITQTDLSDKKTDTCSGHEHRQDIASFIASLQTFPTCLGEGRTIVGRA